jgi:hypothetical protein
VQAALYHATPRLVELANEAINKAADPASMLKHVTSHMGVHVSGRAGIFRIEQLQVLVPHLNLLDEHDIATLWEVCNKNGWATFRRQYLDHRLGKDGQRMTRFSEEPNVAELDDALNGSRVVFTDLWIDDHLRRGFSLDQLIDTTLHWLERNRTVAGMKIVAPIFTRSARRLDLERLQKTIGDVPDCEDLLNDTVYAVTERSLH